VDWLSAKAQGDPDAGLQAIQILDDFLHSRDFAVGGAQHQDIVLAFDEAGLLETLAD